MAKGKTVYILGAGASASEKLPVQSQLLNLIFLLSAMIFRNQLTVPILWD